jgi:hypothetical protein
VVSAIIAEIRAGCVFSAVYTLPANNVWHQTIAGKTKKKCCQKINKKTIFLVFSRGWEKQTLSLRMGLRPGPILFDTMLKSLIF